MFKLTKEQAIEEHRKMWHWIATETREADTFKNEYEYLLQYKNGEHYNKLSGDSFCCEYADGDCDKCPIEWVTESFRGSLYCVGIGLYKKWCFSRTIEESANLAEQIANLPVRED